MQTVTVNTIHYGDVHKEIALTQSIEAKRALPSLFVVFYCDDLKTPPPHTHTLKCIVSLFGRA